jgi:ankyrin repeat protein
MCHIVHILSKVSYSNYSPTPTVQCCAGLGCSFVLKIVCVSDTTLFAITITIMSDSKELSVLRAASQRLIDSDDGTIDEFCHSAADVSAFEDALQQCNTEHFQAEADAPNLSANPQHETVQETMKSTLWQLLYDVLTRNKRASSYNLFSWSVDGHSMVARIAKSILSSWCIDKKWIDAADDEDGNTVLMEAARYGHTPAVEVLLADPRVDKASIDRSDEKGQTALMRAAENGRTSIIELLLADPRVDKASIDHVDEQGQTALMRATFFYRTPIVQLLLADPRVDRASIDHADDTSMNVFMLAASNGFASIIELLLADSRVDKALINHAAKFGWTALMHAAQSGDKSTVELLLADPRVDKASINSTDKYGITPLQHAASYCNFSTIHALISDTRTSWDSIVKLSYGQYIMKRDEILSVVIAELTRRQMCVIYPSANPLLWHVPVQSDAVVVDAESRLSSPVDDDEAREDGIAEPECECALITSFFKSDLFDVNVLNIIREYATYICSTTASYTDSDSD